MNNDQPRDEMSEKFAKNAVAFFKKNPDVLADIQEKLLAFGKATHAERHNLQAQKKEWEVLDGKSLPSYLKSPQTKKRNRTVIWHWFIFRDERLEHVPTDHMFHRTEYLDGWHLCHLVISKTIEYKEHIACVAIITALPTKVIEGDSTWLSIKAMTEAAVTGPDL